MKLTSPYLARGSSAVEGKAAPGRMGGDGGAAAEEFLDRLGILGKIKW